MKSLHSLEQVRYTHSSLGGVISLLLHIIYGIHTTCCPSVGKFVFMIANY